MLTKEETEVLSRLAAEARLSGAGVVADSRRAAPGCVFVAIPGVRDNGERYAPEAVARGAAAVVVKRGARLPECSGARVVPVDNPRLALAFLAAECAGNPSRGMRVFAVTGTNGKTTVAGIVRDILARSGAACGLLSTVENSWPGHNEGAARTTPDPIALQDALSKMLAAGCSDVSMEASSHALDQDRIAFTRLACAGFTNLTQDHFDYHGGFDDYFRCKRKLFVHVGSAGNGARAAINADDHYGRILLTEAPDLGVSAVPYSVSSAFDTPIRALRIVEREDRTMFRLCAFGESVDVETRLIGRHNVSNILCAAAMTIPAGVSLGTVVETITELKPRWGRLEPFPTPNGARFFVDYAHSPDAISQALSALRNVASGRIAIVFGCGGDRDRAKRPLMAAAAAADADFVFVTSDNPRGEDPDSIINEIEMGFETTDNNWTRITDRREAIMAAAEWSRPGDFVLVAGKGHEDYQEIAGVRHHFDDREVVREIIGMPEVWHRD